MSDIIFSPLKWRNLTVKNRIFRSNVTGRFDNYDGSGTQTRINWEEKFARGGVDGPPWGVGAIISSFTPIEVRGRVLPEYATIDDNNKIPFWRAVGEKVHRYNCKFIMQLSHSGRQRDIPGIENENNFGLSATDSSDPIHGLLCEALEKKDIRRIVKGFAQGARRAREAGLDGVELHATNGYLFTQFLSSGINDREDEYGGSLENRYRFLGDVIKAIRREVGDDFHLQVKTNGVDHNDVIPGDDPGNTIEDSIQICQWAQRDGADALHISTGSVFPHPLNPPGHWPFEYAAIVYDIMLSSGTKTLSRYFAFREKSLRPAFKKIWYRLKKNRPFQGVSLEDAARIRAGVNIPVISTGGYQQASFIRNAINSGKCDAVAIARPLIANNDLLAQWKAGRDIPHNPCTYCNKCLINAPKNPLGCYELDRYDGDYEAMIEEIMSVFHPLPKYITTRTPITRKRRFKGVELTPTGKPDGIGTPDLNDQVISVVSADKTKLKLDSALKSGLKSVRAFRSLFDRR